MHHASWNQIAAVVFFALTLIGIPRPALAADEASVRQYVYEVRVYQALTNITGAGLISQTLPGMNGWLQIVHQKLDDVELVMDGATLTWNGQPAPDYARILKISSPTVTTGEGEQANVAIKVSISGPLQYMERRQDSLFELKETQPDDAGLFLKLKPVTLVEDNILANDFSFQYVWVKERKKINGVNLEVGEPILGRVSTEGAVHMRLGEWSCYQTPVESEGSIYVFIRATEKSTEPVPSKDLAQIETAPARQQGSAKTEQSASGPKVTVGGSIELRGGYYSGLK